MIEKIKKDIKGLEKEKEIHSILLYGSYVKKKQHERSDIDICIVAPSCKSVKQKAELLGKVWRKINTEKYDVRLFEEFPLYIKISVINNCEILFSNDKRELQLYFYFYRKLWESQAVNRINNITL